MPKPEKVEEGKFVTKIESHGWECIKLSTAGPYGEKGWNDRLVFASYGVHALFEFKRDGEEAVPLQNYRHSRLKQMGHPTYVVYKCNEAYQIVIELVKKAKEKAQADS